MSHWDFRPPADDAAPPPLPPPPLPRRSREHAPEQADDGVRAGNQGWAGTPATALDGGLPGDPRGSRTTAWYGPGLDDEPDESWDGDDLDAALYPITYERDPLTYERDSFAAADPADPPRAREPWPRAPRPDGPVGAELTFGTGRHAAASTDYPTEEWGSPAGQQDWRGRPDPASRRWLIPAGVAVAGVAVGAAAVLLLGGHPGSTAAGTGTAGTGTAGTGIAGTGTAAAPSATASPVPTAAATGPLTMAEAQGVLAAYGTTNNSANARFDSALLGTIETGSSAAIDAALYRGQQAAGAPHYPAFSAVQATFYIPGDEPATGPRWFVVQVANAFNSSPAKVANTEYLLFTQAAPGGAWQDAIEPYLLRAGNIPRVAVGSDGLATAVSADSTTAAVAPGQLPAVTAASLDAAAGQATVAGPGNLADFAETGSLRASAKVSSVTDTHAAATGADGREFAVRTAGGGALVFYTDTATVTATARNGSGLSLNIPGFFSPGQRASRAVLDYQEQFAAYDPPAGQGAPQVVADYSGITGTG